MFYCRSWFSIIFRLINFPSASICLSQRTGPVSAVKASTCDINMRWSSCKVPVTLNPSLNKIRICRHILHKIWNFTKIRQVGIALFRADRGRTGMKKLIVACLIYFADTSKRECSKMETCGDLLYMICVSCNRSFFRFLAYYWRVSKDINFNTIALVCCETFCAP